MSVKFTPLEDRVTVKQAEAQTQTASGLYIPDSTKKEPQRGEVLTADPDRHDDKSKHVPVDVKISGKVLYSKYGGTGVHYEGKDYLIIGAHDVLAILGWLVA